jgi:hypothetical protein
MIRIFASLIGIASLVLDGQTFSPAGRAQVIDIHTDLVPTWTGGALIAIENQNAATPIIHMYDETGQEMLPIAFSIPGAQAIHIQGFSRGSDGTFAVAGWIAGQDLRPKEGFLSLVSPDHRTIQTTRPAPYFPAAVTIAPDGTLWTMGAEMAAAGARCGRLRTVSPAEPVGPGDYTRDRRESQKSLAVDDIVLR